MIESLMDFGCESLIIMTNLLTSKKLMAMIGFVI